MTNAVERMMKELGVNDTEIVIPWTNGVKTEVKRKIEFTAEKQIELIKFIQDVTDIDCFCSNKLILPKIEKFAMTVHFITEFPNEEIITISGIGDTWEEALAELTIKLKPYIDTAKVKEILQR